MEDTVRTEHNATGNANRHAGEVYYKDTEKLKGDRKGNERTDDSETAVCLLL